MEKSDIIYYLSVGVVCLIMLYIIYVSVNFNKSQQDNLEHFTSGSSGNDKKDKKPSSKAEKAIQNIDTENEKLDDILDLDNETDNIKKLLENLKEKLTKDNIKNIIDNPDATNNIYIYKLNIEAIDMLLEKL